LASSSYWKIHAFSALTGKRRSEDRFINGCGASPIVRCYAIGLVRDKEECPFRQPVGLQGGSIGNLERYMNVDPSQLAG
jgi:hypothetical protein